MIFEKIKRHIVTLSIRFIKWCQGLDREKQIWLVAGVVVLLSTICGPCTEFAASRRELQESAILRGNVIVQLLAAKNIPAMITGNELTFDVASAAVAKGVKDAFITDKNGLIVAPSSRFHEDARKFGVILKVLEDGKPATL